MENPPYSGYRGRLRCHTVSAHTDETSLLVTGPWSHRRISANGNRFHVAEAGTGPLVLFLHGFPDYWWTWRNQLPAFANAGFRAVAMDLRGYAASDKPPRGYDPYTLAGDVTGVIRALGERSAIVVGHDWGGFLGWVSAAFHPKLVSRLAVLSAPHPLLLRRAMVWDRSQRKALRHLATFQLPRYEHVLTRDDGALVGQMIRRWSGEAWRDSDDYAEHERACRTSMQVHHSAFCALEYYRWTMRSLTRRSGWKFASLVNERLEQPVLHIHGAQDSCVLPATARGADKYVAGPYTYTELPDVGHFPHLEAKDEVTAALLDWAGRPA